MQRKVGGSVGHVSDYAATIRKLPEGEISIYRIDVGTGNYIGTNTQSYSDRGGGYHYYVKATIDGKDYIWDNFNNGVPIDEYKDKVFGFDRKTGKEYSGEDLINNSTKIK